MAQTILPSITALPSPGNSVLRPLMVHGLWGPVQQRCFSTYVSGRAVPFAEHVAPICFDWAFDVASNRKNLHF